MTQNLASVSKLQGADLTPVQQKIADEVLAYFSKDEYELPVKEGDRKLMEEERFWLVRIQWFDPGMRDSQRTLDL